MKITSTAFLTFFFLILMSTVSRGQDVTLNSQADVDAFDTNITLISGSLEIQGNDILDLSNLSSILTIEGDLSIWNSNSLVNLTGLSNLTSIDGYLSIAHNGLLENIDNLNKLSSVGTNIGISNCNSLASIEGLSSITVVHNDLKIGGNGSLTNLDGLSSIISIGNSMTISSNQALMNLDGLSGLTTVTGKVIIQNNESLTSIGLSSLEYSFGLTISNLVLLTNLDGLSSFTFTSEIDIYLNPSLINLDGLSQLKSATKLRLTVNNSLTNLDGLANLTYVEGDMDISLNPSLTNLNGLSNITFVSGNLLIKKCNALSNLFGLSSINYIGGALGIVHNASLVNCCGVQNLLSNGYIGLNISIADNPSECSSEEEVLNFACIRNTITGIVFYDRNKNTIQDENEQGIPNVPLTSDLHELLLTNELGFFRESRDSSDVYQIIIEVDSMWELSTDSSSYAGVFIPYDSSNHQKHFGLYPTFAKHDISSNLTSNPTRCNTEVEFFMHVQNQGTYIENGKVQLQYNTESSFATSIPYPDMVDTIDHILTWDIDSLYPFGSLDYSINFNMPDENNTGEMIHFITEIYRDSVGTTILEDTFDYATLVLCSFDPNDKLVHPAGVQEENYTLRDETLLYTIRFQNTGNAEALDINIIDTLDTSFDLASFAVVQSSFPVQTTMDANIVNFFFSDINLPDSTSNEPESHGFVSYEIKLKEDAPDFTVVKNTAHIIFDFNPAIVTNTTTSTMVENIPAIPSFLIEGNQWIYEYTATEFTPTYDQSIETITVVGDTTIIGNTYAVLQATNTPPCDIFASIEYLREDGDKIYRLNKAKDDEFIMIDFGEAQSYELYFEKGSMGEYLDTAIVIIDSFGIEILPNGQSIEVQYTHIINNQSYGDDAVYKVYKGVGFVGFGILFPNLGTGRCDPDPSVDIELKCHISDRTLHFTSRDCDQFDLLCYSSIPREQVVCVAEVVFDSTELLDYIYVNAGTAPYTYRWSAEYTEAGITYTASDFLQDTTIANPVISDFVISNEPVVFQLEITDATGLTCTKDVKVTFSSFSYTLGHTVETIMQGDSIRLGGIGIIGGVPPLSYQVVPDYNVTDPTDPLNTFVSPDTSTLYSVYAVDAAGCISQSNPVLGVTVIPSSTTDIDDDLISYSLFPNPVSEELHLSIKSVVSWEDLTLTIYDSKSKLILAKSITKKESIINLIDLVSGVYFYGLSSKGKVLATGKVIK